MMNIVERQSALLRGRQISLVLDVGANAGQYGISLRRKVGYQGRIISFEPLSDAFTSLQRTAAGDALWECCNVALGEHDETSEINISANSWSSSLLPVSATTVEIEPSISYIGKQTVSVRRLDQILEKIARPNDRIFLKIDTQGYEMRVLKGALGVIDRFELIQVETAFFEAYHGETLVGDMIKFFDYLGYKIVSMDPGWQNSATGDLLEADIIFGRK
jgi:FkbM family methyltransferase